MTTADQDQREHPELGKSCVRETSESDPSVSRRDRHAVAPIGLGA
jgi:hypothetical protein